MTSSMGENGAVPWPCECDNAACDGPLQPDELARWARQRRTLRWTMLAWCALWLLTWASLVVTVTHVEGRMVLHWGTSGPDRWGSPRQYFLENALLQGLWLVLGPGFVALLPKVPQDFVNLTHAEYWKTPHRYQASLTPVAIYLMAVMILVQAGLLATDGAQRWAPERVVAVDVAMVACLLLATFLGIAPLLRALRPPAWWFACRRAHGHRWD